MSSKNVLRKIGIGFLIFFGICFLMVIAGTLLDNNENSPIGIAIVILLSFSLIAAIAIGIAKLIKGLTNKGVKDYKPVEAVTYRDIDNTPEMVNNKAKPETEKKVFKYNENDVATGQNGEELRPWFAVIMALVVLLPLGIYLMILKVLEEKTRCFYNGVKMVVLGSLMIAFPAGLILLFISSGSDSINTLISISIIPGLFLVTGIGTLIGGIYFKKRGRQNDDYMRTIVIDKVTNINTIAAKNKSTYAEATAIITRLIDIGLLKDAYIYHRDSEVIVPGVSKKIALYCKNCGGTTVLYANDKRECCYCGAEL